MMEQLRKLIAIREVRLDRLRAELAQRLAALGRIDEELAGITAELAQIARQRVAWEHEWQRWMHHDRVLRHGQDYNLSHLALSAWERDARQAHEEVSVRRAQAAAEAGETRRRFAKAEQRFEALQEQLHKLVRQHASRRIALADSRSQDERVAAALRAAI